MGTLSKGIDYSPKFLAAVQNKVADGIHSIIHAMGHTSGQMEIAIMKIPELKPCPFCGGAASMVSAAGGPLDRNCRWYKAYCTRCQNRTWEHPKKKDATAAWNKRTIQEA